MTRTLLLVSWLSLFTTMHVAAQKNTNENTIKKWIANNASALNFSKTDVNNLRIASFYYDKFANVTMAYLQQTYKGVDVYNALTTVAFKDGKVVSVTTSRIADVEKLITNKTSKPSLAPAEALRNAAADVNLSLVGRMFPLRQTPDGQEFEYDRLGIGFNNIIVRLMWTNTEEDEHLKLSWQVGIHTLKGNDYWLIKVDAFTGKILRKENLKTNCRWNPVHNHSTQCYEVEEYKVDNAKGEKEVEAISSAKYKVIPYPYMDPDHASPTLVSNPWEVFHNKDATTLKWNNDGSNDYDSTRGNNVLSREDWKDKFGFNTNKGKGAHSTTSLPDLTFNYTPVFTNQPLETTNQSFYITNLFYWNNILHDMEYQYGFDEASGNFQASNLGRGGKGNDYVFSDAQDGSGTDNANFSTPVDGQSPRMQMYLWHYVEDTFLVNQPQSFSGIKPSTESRFGSTRNLLLDKGPITADVVLFNDDAQGITHKACSTASNGSALSGKIALIDRGSCNFTDKVKNAQKAGAKAAIIADNIPNENLVFMSGDDATITIPAVFVSYETGDTIKKFLAQKTTVNITLKSGLYRDGDADNGVITHEYFHGVSNRLAGGPDNVSCLQNGEQMGEGWSDYNALMMTTDWLTAKASDGTLARPIGNYAAGLPKNYGGIRTYPYSTDFSIDPWTYDSLRTSKLFTETTTGAYYYTGEFWCTTLWEMTWELIKSYGINTEFTNATKEGGNTIAMRLVIEGLKLQPCSPGCVDGRDAILKADTVLFGGKYSPEIWKAFARRGLGFSADQGSNKKIKDAQGAYDLPEILPVVWGNFTAEKVNSTALLKWTTVSEQNVDKFVIERSFDGRNYTEIGSVKATGNSSVTRSYTFTDSKPVKGTNSYRIRLTDNDGKQSLSEIRSLIFDEIKNIISIAPNPARDKVMLTVRGNTKLLQIKVYNAVGQQIASYVSNSETLPLDVSQFARGSYYISITGDGISQKEKLVIH